MSTQHHILANMIGPCNTADEAYRVLHYELEAQMNHYNHAKGGGILDALKLKQLQNQTQDPTWETAEHARGELVQFEAARTRVEAATERAEREIVFIKQVMAELEPHRKYRDLPLLDAFEACQAEEWALELVKRAKRFLLTNRTIPVDHFEAMTNHPWWDAYIMPQVSEYAQLAAENKLTLRYFVNDTPPFMLDLRARHLELNPAAPVLHLHAAPSEPALITA